MASLSFFSLFQFEKFFKVQNREKVSNIHIGHIIGIWYPLYLRILKKYSIVFLDTNRFTSLFLFRRVSNIAVSFLPRVF